MSTENMSAGEVLAVRRVARIVHDDRQQELVAIPPDSWQRHVTAVAAMAEREAALVVRLKALESEVSARRSGWASFVDDEDPSLLVVAHHDRSVHFTGASAWGDANAFDAARAEAGHG